MKKRLDLMLVEQKMAPSREKAQAFIMAGKVRVNGIPASKSGSMIKYDAFLEIKGLDQPYVSRGGLKLESALKFFKVFADNTIALDIGASTGLSLIHI